MGSIKESKRECEVPRVQQKLEDITISCPEGGKRALEKLKVWKRGLLTRAVFVEETTIARTWVMRRKGVRKENAAFWFPTGISH